MKIERDTELRGIRADAIIASGCRLTLADGCIVGSLKADHCTLIAEDCRIDAIELEECMSASLRRCLLQSLYALRCRRVRVIACRGNELGVPGHPCWVQLNQCTDGSVESCDVQYKLPGRPDLVDGSRNRLVEDIINLFLCRCCSVRRNWIAWPEDVRLSELKGFGGYSGSGIMLDRGNRKCSATGNVVVNTQNCGIGIAGGVGNRLLSNRVFQKHPGVNGNTPYVIWNQYTLDPRLDRYGGNHGIGNRFFWARSAPYVPDAERWENNRKVRFDLTKERAAWVRLTARSQR